jgi:flagellar FliL protein
LFKLRVQDAVLNGFQAVSALAKKEKTKDEAPPVDGEGAEGGEDAPKKKFPMLIVIIAAVAVLVLGGGGAAAYFLFLAPKHPPAADGGKDAHGDKKAEKKKDDKKGGHGDKKEGGDAKADPKTQPTQSEGPNGTIYYTLPDTIANIQSPSGNPAYLQLKLTFECPDQDTADALDANLPRINDVLQGFMRELRPEDLAGSEGNIELRQEILRRVNLVLAPQKINAVLIEKMVVT